MPMAAAAGFHALAGIHKETAKVAASAAPGSAIARYRGTNMLVGVSRDTTNKQSGWHSHQPRMAVSAARETASRRQMAPAPQSRINGQCSDAANCRNVGGGAKT